MLGTSIPVEMLSMLGGSLIGMIKGYVENKMALEKQRNEIMMAQFDAVNKAQAAAREGPKRGWKGFQWTRRAIALTIVFAVILLPKLVAVFTDINVFYASTASTEISFLFSNSTLKWQVLNGLPITPVDTHSLAAVIGLYFGQSMGGK